MAVVSRGGRHSFRWPARKFTLTPTPTKSKLVFLLVNRFIFRALAFALFAMSPKEMSTRQSDAINLRP